MFMSSKNGACRETSRWPTRKIELKKKQRPNKCTRRLVHWSHAATPHPFLVLETDTCSDETCDSPATCVPRATATKSQASRRPGPARFAEASPSLINGGAPTRSARRPRRLLAAASSAVVLILASSDGSIALASCYYYARM